ncbi:MAG: homoserine kinase [Anaerolineae bacterium]|nr:homoserine kinase [Anaerolineae bacterium]
MAINSSANPYQKVQAFAPATMANMGIGFDILGLAFQSLGDVVEVTHHDKPEVIITDIEGDNGLLPRNPHKNTASVAIMAYLKQLNRHDGIAITIKKGLPLASGLGSSASSAVAGVVAVNALLGYPMTKEELLPACMEGEALVSGYHADNIAPCLLGGLLLVDGITSDTVVRLPIHDNMHFALVTPNVAVLTSEARAVLPQMIPLKTMIKQTAGVARFFEALNRGDLVTLAKAMELDDVVEPARAHLMPYLYELREHAKAHGALGLVISGAGPTLCALCDSADVAKRVSSQMATFYEEQGLGAVAYATQINTEGARVILAE